MVQARDRAEARHLYALRDRQADRLVACGLLAYPRGLAPASPSALECLARPGQSWKRGAMSNLASHETFTDGVRQVRISYFSRYALCICAAAALLAGCGGSQAQGAAWTPSQQNVTGVLANDSNSELHGETFSASGGTFSCAKHADYSISHFATSGNASGPLPGSFSASGSWRLSSGTWSFQEKFEILSGSQTISGKIDKDGT